MIKALIIDDEADSRFILSDILTTYFSESIKIIGEAAGFEEATNLLSKVKADLVFLDIKMPGGSGFDLLRSLESIDFQIVFITAHSEFGYKAFEFSALDYLLKPINLEDLRKTIEKVQNSLKYEIGVKSSQITLLRDFFDSKVEPNKIVVHGTGGFEVLLINNIIRLQGARNYTDFVTIDGRKITTSKSLGEYEDLLLPFGFFRIHQSTIINLGHVVKYTTGDGGTVTTIDGKTSKVSRNRRVQFLNHFK